MHKLRDCEKKLLVGRLHEQLYQELHQRLPVG